MKKDLGYTDNKQLLEVIKMLMEFPDRQICQNYVAATLLDRMAREGFALTEGLAKAVVEADNEAAVEIVNELLK